MNGIAESRKWLLLIILLVGIGFIVWTFRPGRCPISIKENIEMLRQNTTYLSSLFSDKSYYQDVKNNFTLVLDYLNQAEEAWNANRCSEAEEKLKVASVNLLQVSSYLYSKVSEEFLAKTSKAISLDTSSTTCGNGYILAAIENVGTDTIVILEDLQFYLDDEKTIPSDCSRLINPGAIATCKVGSGLRSGFHKLVVVGPSGNATATVYCP